MLHGPRDADSYVDPRPHRLPRLPHLHGVGHPTRVDHGPARPDGRAQSSGQVLQDREVLGAAHAPAAGDDDGGVLQFHGLGGLDLALQDARAFGIGADGRLHLLDLGLAADLGCLDRFGSQQHDRGLGVGLVVGDLGAAEIGDAGHEAAVLRLDVQRVGDQAAAEAGGQAAGHLPRIGGEAEQHQVRRMLLDQRLHGVGGGFGDELAESRILAHVYGLGAVLAQLGGGRAGARAQGDRFGVAQLAGFCQQFQADRGQLLLTDFRIDPDSGHG